MKLTCFCYLAGLAVLAVVPATGYANPGDEVCFAIFRNAGAIPNTQECLSIATTANFGMGTYY